LGYHLSKQKMTIFLKIWRGIAPRPGSPPVTYFRDAVRAPLVRVSHLVFALFC